MTSPLWEPRAEFRPNSNDWYFMPILSIDGAGGLCLVNALIREVEIASKAHVR